MPKAPMGTREAWREVAVSCVWQRPLSSKVGQRLASTPERASEAHPPAEGSYKAVPAWPGRKEALISQTQQPNVAGKDAGGGRGEGEVRVGFLFSFPCTPLPDLGPPTTGQGTGGG